MLVQPDSQVYLDDVFLFSVFLCLENIYRSIILCPDENVSIENEKKYVCFTHSVKY